MEVFEREKDLVDAFRTNTKKFLREVLNKSVSRHFIIEEFDSYIGIADLVLGTYRPYLSKKTCRKSVNLNWIYPLINLKLDQAISIHEFMDKYNFSRKSAFLRLNEYIEAGFLVKSKTCQYLVVKEYEFVTDNVIAIEAKLKNWKRALLQARSYKKFSDFTYILLDESYANPAISNLEEFKVNNIGLITMKNNSFTIHYLPKKPNPKKDNYFIRINEAAYNYFSTTFATI